MNEESICFKKTILLHGHAHKIIRKTQLEQLTQRGKCKVCRHELRQDS